MAIVNSLAVGRSSKSAGNITYRQTRGRTIASQKVGSNPSKTESQVRQRSSFGELGRLAQTLSNIISTTFNKSRYGSSRNTFIKSNTALMEYIRGISDYNSELPPIKNLSTYLSDPASGLKVMLSKGALNVVNSFTWDEQLDLAGAMFLSRDYKAGDRITVYVLYTYLMAGAWFESIKTFTKVLSDTDVSALTVGNRFDVNKQTMPGLETVGDLPPDASDGEFMVTGVVEDSTKRTNSYLTLLPEQSYLLEAASQTIINPQEMQVIFTDKTLFATKVADQAIGGYALFMPDSPDKPYAVKAIAKDAGENPIGLIFGPPIQGDYVSPLSGEDEGPVPLMKDGKVIAWMENVVNPLTAL